MMMMKIVALLAMLCSPASASSEYRLNGNIDPFTLTPSYYSSYYVDDEFVFGGKGQDGFECCLEHDKASIRDEMAQSTTLCKSESNWASMAGGGAKVILQEVTNQSGCTPMPCTSFYGTLNCDAGDEAGCSKVRAKMQQTVDAARIVDVSTDDSGFHPQWKVMGSGSFSFNFNGAELVSGPCSDEHNHFSSTLDAISALRNAAKETNITFDPVKAHGRVAYVHVRADGQCVGDIMRSQGYDVMKILLRYAENAPVIHAAQATAEPHSPGHSAKEGEDCCDTRISPNPCVDQTHLPGCATGLRCHTPETTWKPGKCAPVMRGPGHFAKEGEACCDTRISPNRCVEQTHLPGCGAGLQCHTGEAAWKPGKCAPVLHGPGHFAKEGEACCDTRISPNRCMEQTHFPECATGLECHTGEATWKPGKCAPKTGPSSDIVV